MQAKDSLVFWALGFAAASVADWAIQSVLTDAAGGGTGLMGTLSNLANSGVLVGAALGLVLAWLFLSYREVWALFRPQKLEEHYNRTFSSEIVLLDGKAFYDCTFVDVTFRWNGGLALISKPTITGAYRFETQHHGVLSTMDLLRVMGALEPAFAGSLKALPAVHFKS